MDFLCIKSANSWIFDTSKNLCYNKKVGAAEKASPDFLICKFLAEQRRGKNQNGKTPGTLPARVTSFPARLL
jgi:hypothetical protein